MAADPKRIVALVLLGVAGLGAILIQFLPWAGINILGMGMNAHLWGFSFNLGAFAGLAGEEAAALGGFHSWYGSMGGEGCDCPEMQIAAPLVSVGGLAAILAAVLSATKLKGGNGQPAGILGFVGAALIATGAILYTIKMNRPEEGGFAAGQFMPWSFAYYVVWTCVAFLIAGGVLAMLRASSPRPAGMPPGGGYPGGNPRMMTNQAGRPGYPATPAMGRAASPSQGNMARPGMPARPGAAPPRPGTPVAQRPVAASRWVACPKCNNRFVAAAGKPARCTKCGFTA